MAVIAIMARMMRTTVVAEIRKLTIGAGGFGGVGGEGCGVWKIAGCFDISNNSL